MTARTSRKARIRKRRVYLTLSGLLAAVLLLLVFLEHTKPAPGGTAGVEPRPKSGIIADGQDRAAGEPLGAAEGRDVPAPAPRKESAPPGAQGPAGPPAANRVAIIIDDVGYHGELDALATSIPFPLTFSVLPGLDCSTASAVRLREAGCEVMLHLPMEPERYPEHNPGPGALYTFMTHDELRWTIRDDIRSVPGARGVNNHMGSLFTMREDLLSVVFEELKRHGLYFVDSRTTTETVAQKVAQRHGVRTAGRSVFIDNSEDVLAITSQLELLFQTASREHSAIGIGHFRESTLVVLAAEVPKLCLRYPEVELVHASDVVH
jgi:polysaccharide deacetylase 2 family uncharacterized protein YibQ